MSTNKVQLNSNTGEFEEAAPVTAIDTGSNPEVGTQVQYNLEAGVTFSTNSANEGDVVQSSNQSHMAGSEANDGSESVVASAQTGLFTSDELSASALKAGSKEGDTARVKVSGMETDMLTALSLGYVKINEFGYYVDADSTADDVTAELTKEEDTSEKYEAVALDETSAEAMGLLQDTFSEEVQDTILAQVVGLQTGDIESMDVESLTNSLGGELSGITAEQLDMTIGAAYMGFQAQANQLLTEAGVVGEQQDAFRVWAATQHKAEFSDAMRMHYLTRDPAKSWNGLIGKFTAGAGSAGIKNGAADRFDDPKDSGTVVVNGMEMTRKMAIQMGFKV